MYILVAYFPILLNIKMSVRKLLLGLSDSTQNTRHFPSLHSHSNAQEAL